LVGEAAQLVDEGVARAAAIGDRMQSSLAVAALDSAVAGKKCTSTRARCLLRVHD